MESAKIIIIGAGIAGIGAAEMLIANGFKDVTILEGGDRIGGRIQTEQYGDSNGSIEMGAQWIHGEDCNPVFELACKHDLVDQQALCNPNKKESRFYLSSGTFICPSVIRETCMVLDNIFNEANKFSREQIPIESDQATVGTFVQDSFYNFLRTSTDSDEVKKMKDGLFNWRLNMEKTENGCSSLYDMSLCAWGEYIQCAGEEAVELSRGYQPVLDLFLKNIPIDCFHLKKLVKQVRWYDESVVDNSDCNRKSERKCKVVTSCGLTYDADHVIVTSSLGYLKVHSCELFLPTLPQSKMSAINRLGFGTVNKIYLEFDEPFWDECCRGIQLAWLPDDHLKLKCLERRQLVLGNVQPPENDIVSSEWYKGIHGFDVVAQHTNLLCGWIAGAEAEQSESLSDDVVLDVCHELLMIFTNRSDLKKPTNIVRTRWFSNQCVLGSYSYRHTGSSISDSVELSRPLPSADEPRLQFAGEATHQTYFSTTHGALLSGQREAERIISFYGNQCSSI